MERLTKCGNCRFFCLFRATQYGWCRALPPVTDQEHRNAKGVWPITECTDWCGAWQAGNPFRKEEPVEGPVTGPDPRD